MRGQLVRGYQQNSFCPERRLVQIYHHPPHNENNIIYHKRFKVVNPYSHIARPLFTPSLSIFILYVGRKQKQKRRHNKWSDHARLVNHYNRLHEIWSYCKLLIQFGWLLPKVHNISRERRVSNSLYTCFKCTASSNTIKLLYTLGFNLRVIMDNTTVNRWW